MLEDVERKMIRDALAAAQTAGGAARMLGVTPYFLCRRAKQLGVPSTPPKREVPP